MLYVVRVDDEETGSPDFKVFEKMPSAKGYFKRKAADAVAGEIAMAVLFEADSATPREAVKAVREGDKTLVRLLDHKLSRTAQFSKAFRAVMATIDIPDFSQLSRSEADSTPR